MFGISRETVERIKKEYPVGCTVGLRRMDDIHAPAPGTLGKVYFVDDTATIHVRWENGSSLGVVYGEDACDRVN